MHRPRLTPTNLLTAFSLSLCLANIALWIASYHGFEDLGHTTPKGSVSIANPQGQLIFYADSIPTSELPSRKMGFGYKHANGPVDMEALLGEADQRFGPISLWTTPPYRILAIDFWFLATLFAAFPAARRLIRLRQNRRHAAQNLCPHCNYDLRATPVRCPECGWTAPSR